METLTWLQKKSFLYKVLLAGAGLCVGIGLALYWFAAHRGPDAAMQRVFKEIPTITTYSQTIETQTLYSGELLAISGIYEVDYPHKAYAAYSTTTLFASIDNKPHAFTTDEITIGDNVYAKIDTTDPLLKPTIKRIPTWQHFSATSIPAQFTGAVIAGPIEDTLQILSDNGAYLSLIKQAGPHYTFKLSGVSPKEDGPLMALLSRVATGTVEVWIDPQTTQVQELVFTNYPFVSTTTISDINALLPITAPVQ